MLCLKKGKFIIDDDIDEIELIKLRSNLKIFNNNELVITIAPTLKCNFSCIYCYEAGIDKNNYIKNKREYINGIKKLIEQQEKKFNITSISICWYGGELLLEYDFIVQCCKELNEFIKQKNKNVIYSMISNGYMLDLDKAIELKELGFKNVQITVDGTEDFHNKRRVLTGGQKTFNKILENIHQINGYLMVSLRVNIDKSNVGNMDEFLDYLDNSGLKNKVNISFAPTRDNGICHSIMCIRDREFAEIIVNLYTMAFKKGFYVDCYPKSTDIYCRAVTQNSFVIEPDGTIQKCWNVIGKKECSIGNIYNLEELTNSTNYAKWLNWTSSIYKHNECAKCNILPLCVGGCAYEGIVNNNTPKCILEKYNIKEEMKFSYDINKSQRI